MLVLFSLFCDGDALTWGVTMRSAIVFGKDIYNVTSLDNSIQQTNLA